MPRPGAVSLAHRGVLFLDEAPEFSPRVLQTLRQPIEHGELTIHRAGGVSRFPARFQLIMAANPCPCGRYSTQNLGCECRPVERRRYFGRLSGPLMDRVDVHCAVGPVRAYDLADTAAEDSATVAARVLTARHIAAERFAGTPWRTNGEASGSWLRARLGGSKALLAPLDALVASGRLTMRSADRIVKLAWTVADLAGAVAPSAAEIDAALTLRDSGGLT